MDPKEDDTGGQRPRSGQPEVASSDDAEEQPTEVWAPVARSLFKKELKARGGHEPEEDSTFPEALLASQSISGEVNAGASGRPEEQDTDPSGPPDLEPADTGATLDMSPAEQAAAFYRHQRTDPAHARAHSNAEAEARRLLKRNSVEVYGEEAEAAHELEQQEAERDDTESTVVVEPPGYSKAVPHECRICGHKISRPRARWLRGPVHSVDGFKCEKCRNVFCAAHVARVSGLLESVLRGARFRCLLCVDQPRYSSGR